MIEGDSDHLLDGLSPRTNRIVEDAATILEEELAHGLEVARGVERRLFSGSERDPAEIVSRFREDTHQLVDVAADLLSGAMGSLDRLAGERSAVTIREEDRARVDGGAQRVPTLPAPEVVAPGATVDVAMSVENRSDQPTGRFALNASDLVSASGDRISADRVTFTPKSVKVEPATTSRVTVKLSVPKQTPPGTYSGLLQATRLEAVRAVLRVTVG